MPGLREKTAICGNVTFDELLAHVEQGLTTVQDVEALRSFLDRLRQIAVPARRDAFQVKQHCTCARCALVKLLREYGIL